MSLPVPHRSSVKRSRVHRFQQAWLRFVNTMFQLGWVYRNIYWRRNYGALFFRQEVDAVSIRATRDTITLDLSFDTLE
jgi:hypothetical protein